MTKKKVKKQKKSGPILKDFMKDKDEVYLNSNETGVLLARLCGEIVPTSPQRLNQLRKGNKLVSEVRTVGDISRYVYTQSSIFKLANVRLQKKMAAQYRRNIIEDIRLLTREEVKKLLGKFCTLDLMKRIPAAKGTGKYAKYEYLDVLSILREQ